jgi:O-antigen/teichoic acid export membrane protein
MQSGRETQQSNKYLRLLSDVGVFAVGNLLAKLIQYFLLPLYTSAMTTETYGTAELLNNLSEMLFPIVTLAIYEAAFRFAVDRDSDLDALLYESTGLLVKMFLGLFAAVLVFQRIIGYEYTYELMFVLAAYSFRMLFANYARGGGYVKTFSLNGVVNAFALAVFSWLFLIQLDYGVRGYLMALGCAHIASVVVLLIGAGIPKRLALRKRDKALLTRMLRYSVPLIFNNIAWSVTSLSGRYVVLFACGAGIAGLYTAANKLPAAITVVSSVFQQAWQLNSAREFGSREQSAFYENVWRLYSAAILMFGAAVIAFTPVLAAMTLKKDFFEAWRYIPPMMLSAIIHSLSTYFGSILLACKQTKTAMNGMLLGAAINLCLAIALIGPLGIWGVLTASVICYLAILLHRIVCVRREVTMNLHLKQVIPLFLLLLAEAVLMCFDLSLCRWLSWGICALMLAACFAMFCADIAAVWQKHRQRQTRKAGMN